ncbi:S1C family serine protease [Pengzhenrongella sicca]|uniref:Trypsin-like peptidase domain-containing protein n=1 Tax=Pengzhenrongella sicca TaxID=2819238 RepID=A0A8A4ZF66_9MICO|nr:trypsin-like peptidase domain-containing protein [Pengzhenrongella sicca]QTE29137.1 trypsin-like peptidase domain-containing protein [Pengzhenrongella sicca]
MNSPENEQTPVNDAADQVGAAPGSPETQPEVATPRDHPTVPLQVPAQQDQPTLPLQVPAPQDQPTLPLQLPTPPPAPQQAQSPTPSPVPQPLPVPVPAAPATQAAQPFAPQYAVPHQASPGIPSGSGAPAAPGAPGWGHPTAGQPAAPVVPGQPASPGNDPFQIFGSGGTVGSGGPGGSGGSGPTATAAPAPAAPNRPQRMWVTVVGAAAAAALIASLATVGLTVGFDGNDSTSTPSSLSTIGESSTDTSPVSGSTSENPDWEKVAAAVSSSVVAIQVSTANGGAEGSGVIIDAEGHVLTNNHVVDGADSVQVTLSDGRMYDATIVGTDSTTDLAVVQITDAPDDLKPAALGDSDAVTVGAAVMAVGNPLGLANTVTTGIVSALDRPVSASAETSSDVVVTNAIQIDAAINPGNSGGPLFDAEGRVIGITSSIATLSGDSSSSGSIGLGFAIPINLAQDIASQLVETGTAEHAFLGVSLTDGDATADGTTRKGAVVEEVTDGSPAAEGEIAKGDVIVAIDGDPVAGAESLTAYVRERSAGSTAVLTLVRDGKALDVTVTLAAKAATPAAEATPDDQGSSDNGLDQGGQNPFDEFFGNQG